MMGLFKYTGWFTGGRTINGYKSIQWVERYREPGSFEIKAPLSSGLKDFLPLGTLISHLGTYEVMIVEDHAIDESIYSEPELTITGRTMETILDQRVTGLELLYGGSATVWMQNLNLAADYSWAQAAYLINLHVQQGVASANNAIPNVWSESAVTGSGTSVARSLARESLHKTVLDLLKVDNCGIQTIRINPFGKKGYNDSIVWRIHKGVDRTKTVIFSWKTGDLIGAQYLWSDQTNKNTAYIYGKWVNTLYPADNVAPAGMNRRIIIVNASDLDEKETTYPSGTPLTNIIAQMNERGAKAIQAGNRIALSGADLTEVTRYQYRRDFDIGDIVMLDSNFGQIAPYRVVEFAEIWDENEFKGVPTLEVPDPQTT